MAKLYYKIIGKGPTIVFLHGFLEQSKMWENYLKLSQKFQVLLIDLPGHGKSLDLEIPEIITMEFMAKHINEILIELNINTVILIGHSMGGYIGLAFAELFPNKLSGLGLFFSTPTADSIEKKQQRLKAISTVTLNKQRFIELSIPTLFNQHKLSTLKKEIDQTKQDAMETNLQAITACLNGMRERQDRTITIQNLQIPCFVLLGIYDPAVNALQVKSLIGKFDHIKILELPIGHMGHLEAPLECYNFIQNYLNQFI